MDLGDDRPTLVDIATASWRALGIFTAVIVGDVMMNVGQGLMQWGMRRWSENVARTSGDPKDPRA